MSNRVREAMAAGGLDIPDEFLGVVEAGVRPLLAGLDALTAHDFGATAPFAARRPADDASAE